MSYAATNAASRGTSLRLGLMLPFAALVTAILFLGMGALIGSDEIALDNPAPTPVFNITREMAPDEGVTPVEQPPTKLTKDPPPMEPREWTANPPEGTGWAKPADPGSTIMPTGDTGAITASAAVLQFNPDYPPRCAARGIEGRVTVAFDVLANGSVANQRIVRSTDSCFDRAALQAIGEWKFMPSPTGGSGIVQRGVQKTFVFSLQG